MSKVKRILSVILVLFILLIVIGMVISLLKAAFKLFAIIGTVLFIVLIISWVFLKITKKKPFQDQNIIDGEAREE